MIWLWIYLASAPVAMLVTGFVMGLSGEPHGVAIRSAVVVGWTWPITLPAFAVVCLVEKAFDLGGGLRDDQPGKAKR